MNKAVLIVFGILTWVVLLLLIGNQIFVDWMLAQSKAQLNRLEARMDELKAHPTPPASSIAFPNAYPAFPPGGRRPWGPEQVIGPPDTMDGGDYSTAWASRTADGGPEWLKVDFEREIAIAEVIVRETYNPGAIVKVTAILANGEEKPIWEGEEPPIPAPINRSFPVKRGKIVAKSVRIDLDSVKVPGWNEIDAVELVGTDGSRQWARDASASSSYADPR